MKNTSKLRIIVKPNRPVLTNNLTHNLQMVRAHIRAVRQYYRMVQWSSDAK